MSGHDQCPSTLKKSGASGASALVGAAGSVVREAAVPRAELGLGASASGSLGPTGATGRARVWRSIEEYSQQAEFREFVEREFPKGASELLKDSRRDFIKYMGAGLALAGLATVPGCRRPEHHIMPYSREVPEDVVPGKPLYYATSMALPGGGAEGLLVETHEARPTKVEGNPLHPVNRGKSSVWAQASILGLYDPDRLKFPTYKNPVRGKVEATWDDFRQWRIEHFAAYEANRGQGLVFLADKKTSPSRDAMRDAVRAKWPAASWIEYDALARDESVEATRLAFGVPCREVLSLARAKRIVSIDRDFLEREAGAMVNAREFASGRRPMTQADDMSRLYVIEPRFTATGAAADHRWRVAPSRLGAALVSLGRAILAKLAAAGSSAESAGLRAALEAHAIPGEVDVPQNAIDAMASDLVEHRGESLIVGGETLGARGLAVIHALNLALGNTGRTVGFIEMGDGEATSSSAGMLALGQMLRENAIRTLVCLDTNPVHNAPCDIGLTGAVFEAIPATITLSVGKTETEAASTWSLNAAHAFEAWGDTEALDGTIAPIQPMIAPLYEPALSELEFLSLLASVEPQSGRDIVKDAWARRLGPGADPEQRWRRALHDGMVSGTTSRAGVPAATRASIFAGATAAAGALAMHEAPTVSAMDVVFFGENQHDGRFANQAWLQELPQFGTRVVWDNPALVSPATARALGIMPDDYTARQIPHARLVEVGVGGVSMTIAAWILPGMADNTIALQTGFGRTTCGVVGEGSGFNVFAVRSTQAPWLARGVSVRKASGSYEIVSTQNHWTIEGRDSIVRTMDLERFRRFGDKVEEQPDNIYGHANKRLNMAEALGELAHTPPNVGAYANPYNNSAGDPSNADRVRDALGRSVAPQYATGPQWGMTIDMSSCTGCGACTAACQAENNIPVVGKREVAKGREMAWIRVDRYYMGESLDDPSAMSHQPVACVHCENAPCETVCPVNATTHGREGTNDMVYNRCIGTRYCANNCPYKVRRFNFFDYAQTKFNGTWVGQELLGRPQNINFIPPSLREKMDEISKMQQNPDVTVRGRGVMEKCSYCVQRVNRARFETKLQHLAGIPEGFFEVACQQACPSSAITFGDTLDPQSAVSRTRASGRNFMLLGYLNTRPRTTHMARVTNPNPALVPEARREEWEHDPFSHGGPGGGHGTEDPGVGEHGTGEPGHDAPAGGAGVENLHSFRRVPGRRSEDSGYLGSLSVLGNGTPGSGIVGTLVEGIVKGGVLA